jgi:hypothetical protein
MSANTNLDILGKHGCSLRVVPSILCLRHFDSVNTQNFARNYTTADWEMKAMCRTTRSQIALLYYVSHLGIMEEKYVIFSLLKPAGYVMHQQLTFNNYTLCPHCIYVFCIYLKTNSDMCHLHHKLFGFYNREEKCLQRGTDWAFKQSSLRFVFKGLVQSNS